jgi:cytochrome oxidase Cu insertion factor (SCO1/SenC/PrrC family)
MKIEDLTSKKYLKLICIVSLILSNTLNSLANPGISQREGQICRDLSKGAGGAGHDFQEQAIAADDDHDQKQGLKQKIPDLVVLNQDGKKVHFYTDLIKGKIVVVNILFTTCNLLCPMQGDAFSKLQAALGERLGKDVFLISITSDPLTDTPERLKAWGAKYGAKPGWTFVTGDENKVHQLLIAFTGAISGSGEHTPIALILNGDKRMWIREYGFSAPNRIISIINTTMRE